MKPIYVILIAIVAFGLGVGAGVLGLLQATGGVSEPSRDVADVAPTLSLNQPTPTPNAITRVQNDIAEVNDKIDTLQEQVSVLSTAIAEQPAPVAAEAAAAEGENEAPAETEMPQPEATEAATEATDEAAESEDDEAADTSANGEDARALFRINDEESIVRFKLDEILNGTPTAVVGETDNVGGDIIINFDNPAASQIGTIAINARTLKTDNEFRDQSVRGLILQTNTHEFIEFVPSEITDLTSDPIATGESVEFQIIGDLTVKGVTNEVTFDASVTLVADDMVEGFASTQILFPDFDITVEAPPQVGGVEEDVILEIEFIAELVDETA